MLILYSELNHYHQFIARCLDFPETYIWGKSTLVGYQKKKIDMKGIVCVANTFMHETCTWKKKLYMLFMFLLVLPN